MQGPGQSVTFSIQSLPPGAAAYQTVTLCTVPSGANGCVATVTPTLPAGTSFYIQMDNGPGGAFGSSVQLGYTMHAV